MPLSFQDNTLRKFVGKTGSESMDIIQFLSFSVIEWLALIILTFAMFKFPLKGYWGQILLTSAVMAFFSYFVFQIIDRHFATFLQPPILFLFFWQMFRIHIFYAGLMTVYGYLGYSFIQYSLFMLMLICGIPLEQFLPNAFTVKLAQAITAVVSVIISRFLLKARLGFSFVPDFEYAPFALKGINLKLFMLTILGYACLSFTSFVSFSSLHVTFMFMLFVCVVLVMLLYYALRKELSDD